MKTIYASTFVSVGTYAAESLEDNFIITFVESAPADIAEYCFTLHPEIRLQAALNPGCVIVIGEQTWPVTAVGTLAEINLRELGHITVKFDGALEAALPGAVHVAGPTPATIEPDQTFCILSE